MPLIDLLEICSLSYLTRCMDELRNKILPTCSVHFKFLKFVNILVITLLLRKLRHHILRVLLFLRKGCFFILKQKQTLVFVLKWYILFVFQINKCLRDDVIITHNLSAVFQNTTFFETKVGKKFGSYLLNSFTNLTSLMLFNMIYCCSNWHQTNLKAGW